MMRRMIAGFLALMLCLLCGCGVREEQVTEGLHLYHLTQEDDRLGGDIISATLIPWEELPESREEQAAVVLEQLLNGINSPLPRGTVLRSVTVSGSSVHVDLGGAYSQLSGVDLTIADYCIALSLTQLTGIYAVRVLCEGHEVSYRSKQLLLASDALLSSMDDVVRTLTATLYFPDETGALVAEDRLLTQYEGDSTAQVVLEALLEGPQSDELLPLLPEGIVGISVRLAEGQCHLNVPADSLSLLQQSHALDAIADSLLSAEGIRSVLLYVDGEPQGELE